MDRTKEYSFVLSTMPLLHARSRLLELGVWFSLYGADLRQQNKLDGIHFVCCLVELKYDTSKLFSRRLDSDS